MAQWSEEKQKTFTDEWNKIHEEKKLLDDKDPLKQFSKILKWEGDMRTEFKNEIIRNEGLTIVETLDKITAAKISKEADALSFLQLIRRVSILAYEDCIKDKQKRDLAEGFWTVKPYLNGGKPVQKDDRNVVEIKYDIRSRFEWDKKELENVFNPDE